MTLGDPILLEAVDSVAGQGVYRSGDKWFSVSVDSGWQPLELTGVQDLLHLMLRGSAVAVERLFETQLDVVRFVRQRWLEEMTIPPVQLDEVVHLLPADIARELRLSGEPSDLRVASDEPRVQERLLEDPVLAEIVDPRSVLSLCRAEAMRSFAERRGSYAKDLVHDVSTIATLNVLGYGEPGLAWSGHGLLREHCARLVGAVARAQEARARSRRTRAQLRSISIEEGRVPEEALADEHNLPPDAALEMRESAEQLQFLVGRVIDEEFSAEDRTTLRDHLFSETTAERTSLSGATAPEQLRRLRLLLRTRPSRSPSVEAVRNYLSRR